MNPLPLYSLLLIALLPAGTASPQEPGGDAAEVAQASLAVEPLTPPVSADSALPNLAPGPDGSLLLSWFDYEGRSSGVLRLSSFDGQKWSAPVDVVRGDDLFLNWADFPSVCALESGVLMAHWLRRTGEGYAYVVEFALSSDAGRTWTEPALLHSDRSPTEHGFVSIAPLDGETFAAIWLDGRNMAGHVHGAEHGGGEMALYFRTVGKGGELGEERALDSRVCDCCQTSLVVTAGGGLVATYRDRSAEEIRDVSLVRFDGEAWSSPASVHDDGWNMPGCPVNGPRTVAQAGSLATAWFTGVGEGGGSVRLAFRAPGAKSYGFPIDVDDGLPIGRVDLVFADEDSVLVSWLEFAGEGGGAEWRVRRVWRDGRKGEASTVASVSSDRPSGFLRMVRSGEDALLAWTASDPERRVEVARLRSE